MINSYNKTNQMHYFLKLIFGIKLYMFQTVPLSIITGFSLYTQQWCMSYRYADSLRAGSGWNWFGSAAVESNEFRPDPARKLSANLYDIPLPCVQ